ncbi:MAG: magnesium transporter [Clostridia bacterium]|nr:magnesium transporter [Clostridia bacterium]
MSRETDLKALKQLKNDMVEADAFAELAKEEWDKSREIKQELDNAKFVFKPLPTDNEATVRADFKESWKKFFGKTGKFKAIFLGLYSVAMVAFAVMLFMDAYKNSCTIFKQPHKWDEPAELILTGIIAAAFPIIAAFFSWVHVVSSDNRGPFGFVGLIALGISGVLFAVVCDWTKSMHLLLVILGSLVAAILICFVIQLIFFIISKLPPAYSGKQRAIIAAEKQKDIDNTELNRVNEVKEREEWETWWAQRKVELKEMGLDHISRGDAAMEKAKAHLASAEASDILGDDEKAPEIIDMLIHFIESRRADNIKEALHEYDAMKQNQKLLEIEAMKVQVEIEKAMKENADRQYEMEMNRRHQIEMEAQARRNADMQSQIAANTAAAAATAERMRKDAASAAADAAATQARVASDISALYRQEYYNS